MAAEVGEAAGAVPPRGRCGQRGGGRRSRPGGAGVEVGGRSARTPGEGGGRRPRGAPLVGRGGWDSAAAPRPEDDEPPRCPRGDRRGGNSRSGRGGGGRRGHVCGWHGRGSARSWGLARACALRLGSARLVGPQGAGERSLGDRDAGKRRDGGHVHGALPFLLLRPLCALWPRLRTPSPPGFAGLRRGSWGRGAYPGTEPGRPAPPLVACANVPDITMGRWMRAASDRLTRAVPGTRLEGVSVPASLPARGHPHVLGTPAPARPAQLLPEGP